MVGSRSVLVRPVRRTKRANPYGPLWDGGHSCVRSKWTVESGNTGHSYVRSNGTTESGCKPPESSQRIKPFLRHREHSVNRWPLPKSAATNDQQQTAIGQTVDRTTNRSVTQTSPPRNVALSSLGDSLFRVSIQHEPDRQIRPRQIPKRKVDECVKYREAIRCWPLRIGLSFCRHASPHNPAIESRSVRWASVITGSATSKRCRERSNTNSQSVGLP